MTYATGGLIQASDISNIIGTSPGTTANVVNTTWAVGGTTAGYGQAALTAPSVAATVAAANWTPIVSAISNCAAHQGTSISAMTTPVVGGAPGNVVTYQSAITTNAASIYTSKLNAAAQGAHSYTTYTHNTAYAGTFFANIVASFANADATRYFFNAGGQIKFQYTHPNGSSQGDLNLRSLCQGIATIVFSAPASGSATIVGTSYTGVTRVGGSGTNTTNTNNGYYAMSTSSANLSVQDVNAANVVSQLAIAALTNGTQGSNGDKGNMITFSSKFEPNASIATGTTVTIEIAYPSTAYLANTWGTVTVNNTWNG